MNILAWIVLVLNCIAEVNSLMMIFIDNNVGTRVSSGLSLIITTMTIVILLRFLGII